MAASLKKPAGGAVPSRSRLIIAMLVISLVLVLGLAWQAHQATRTHLATATSVLREYAMLVADEYSRRVMGDVGYYGYYTYSTWLRRQAEEKPDFPVDLSGPDPESPVARAAALADYLYLFDISAGEIVTTRETAISSELSEFLGQQATTFVNSPLPETGFAVIHSAIGERSHTFVMSASNDLNRVFGFEVDRTELSSWLEQTFEKGTLLPQSLAGGAITNEFVYLQFADDSEQVLFESSPDYDPYLRISKSMHDEYGGIFKGYTISAGIDPAIAGSLVIGGLPRSRVPVLIAILLLTVGLLVAAIRQMQREREVMRLRTNFVSEVSHELRTPLTQIRMFAETLLFDRVRSDEDRQRALEIINRESQRLIHLVENVLQFSEKNGERGELRIDQQLIGPLVDRVVDEFSPLASAAGVELTRKVDPAAVGRVDSNAVRQILLNLLDNAVKYGPAGQGVRIELSQHHRRVCLSVTDQGPGIPRKDRERIWGGYYRLDRERKSAIAGTGIGLSVVRELVARQGGKCWVEDGDDGGARFTVEFPSSSKDTATRDLSSAAPAEPASGEPV